MKKTIQLKLPVEIEKKIKISDPVYSFSELVRHIDLSKYLTVKERRTGRPRYDEETLLKIILFVFMKNGYASLRNIEKYCETDIRYMWLLGDNEPPSHTTIDNFMNNTLLGRIDEILADINAYIFAKEDVDLNHVYIDGTKMIANANKYSLVWKKSCVKNRLKIFAKVTDLIGEMNEIAALQSVKIETREEYAIEYLKQILKQFVTLCSLEPEKIVRGRGHHKSTEQRLYDKLSEYISRLKKYAEHIEICDEDRKQRG